MPPDSIIPGHLEMSRLPLQDMPALPVWDDVLSNKLLVVLAVQQRVPQDDAGAQAVGQADIDKV